MTPSALKPHSVSARTRIIGSQNKKNFVIVAANALPYYRVATGHHRLNSRTRGIRSLMFVEKDMASCSEVAQTPTIGWHVRLRASSSFDKKTIPDVGSIEARWSCVRTSSGAPALSSVPTRTETARANTESNITGRWCAKSGGIGLAGMLLQIAMGWQAA